MAQWLRMWMLHVGMEIPGLNPGIFLTVLSHDDCSIRVSDPAILHLFSFCFITL